MTKQPGLVDEGSISTKMRRNSLFLPDYLEEIMAKAAGREKLGKAKILRNASLRALMEIAHEYDETLFVEELGAKALTDFEADEELVERIYHAVNAAVDDPETK